MTVVVAFVLLAADAAAQDYFPGFEGAAQADVVHVTSAPVLTTMPAFSPRRSSRRRRGAPCAGMGTTQSSSGRRS